MPLREPKYFVWLRIISVIVIFTFVTTQFDARLAFAYPASAQLPGPQNSALNKNNLKDQTKKKDLFGNVRYSEDFSDQNQTTQPQVSVTQVQTPPTPEPSTPTPEPTTNFMQGSPLAGIGEGSLQCSLNPDATEQTCSLIAACKNPPPGDPNCDKVPHAYYKTDLTRGDRIIEIGDLTDPNHPNELEIRQFSYTDGESPTVKIVTLAAPSSNAVDAYQIFSIDSSNNPLELLESGIVEQGQAIAERIYDRENHELRVYDPATYVHQVWELTGSTIGKLLAYQGDYDHDQNPATLPISVDVEYQYGSNSVTFNYNQNDADTANDTFMTQSLDGRFINSGIWMSAAEGNPTAKILQEISANTYRFYSQTDPDYLEVVEKLEGDAVGRLLEYQGPDPNNSAARIHLQYVYDDANKVLTYLQYNADGLSGTFYRVHLLQDTSTGGSGLWEKAGEFIESGTFAIVSNGAKYQLTLKQIGSVAQDPSQPDYIQEYERLSNGQLGRLLMYHGPPEVGQNTVSLQDYSLIYDDLKHQAIRIDRSNSQDTISIYQLSSDGKTPGSLLQTGYFNDSKEYYSVQVVGTSEVIWHNYGPNHTILDSDDEEIPAPELNAALPGTQIAGGGSNLTAPRSSSSSQDPSLDEKIKRLK